MRRGTVSKLSQNSSTIDRQEAIDPIREATPVSRPARGRHHPLERDRARQVLEPAHRRLRAEIGAALRQPADRQLEGRVGAQRVAVVAVGVAGGDEQRTEADHLRQPMPHPLGRPWILKAAGQALGDPQLALDLGQHQHARVRG
jgi:hypothetical protein